MVCAIFKPCSSCLKSSAKKRYKLLVRCQTKFLNELDANTLLQRMLPLKDDGLDDSADDSSQDEIIFKPLEKSSVDVIG